MFGVLAPLHNLHQDRDSEMVWSDTILFHHSCHDPSLIKITRSTGNSRIDHAIERHVIGTHALASHLSKHLLCRAEVTLLAIALQECVVGDNIWSLDLPHLPHQLTSAMNVAT